MGEHKPEDDRYWARISRDMNDLTLSQCWGEAIYFMGVDGPCVLRGTPPPFTLTDADRIFLRVQGIKPED